MDAQNRLSSRDSLTRNSLLKRAAAGGIVLGASGLAAACGSSSDSSSSATSASGSTSVRKTGGSLRIGISGGSTSETLDAHVGSSVGYPSIARARQLYETLAEYDHQFKIRFALAESITPNSTARCLDDQAAARALCFTMASR